MTIFNDFHWTLRVGKRIVSVSETSDRLDSVESVTKVLSLVEASKICAGNPDSKFSCLSQWNRGIFSDHHGKLITY